MNLLLLRDEDFVAADEARLEGRRAKHAREVLKAQAGDRLRVGRLGGPIGEAEVLEQDKQLLRLRVTWTGEPPPRPKVDLILAIPRPKALKKVLPSAASLGLEQARDTKLPELLVRERFRPFVEDELDSLFPSSVRLLPHPTAAAPVPTPPPDSRVTLAIGPEGGWIPFEVELLSQHSFQPVSLGPRILRVETVVPYVLGRLGDRGRA